MSSPDVLQKLAGLVRNKNATPGGSPAVPPQPGGPGNAAGAGPTPTAMPTPAGKPEVDDLTRLLLMPQPDRAPSAAAATATPPPATPPAAAAEVDNPLLRALLGAGHAAAPATPTRSASHTPPEVATLAPPEPTTPAAKPAAPADAPNPEEDPYIQFFKLLGLYPRAATDTSAPAPAPPGPPAASTPTRPPAGEVLLPPPPPPRAPVPSSGSASPSTMVLVSPSSGLAPRPPAGSQPPLHTSAPNTPNLAHKPRADGAIKAPASYIAAAPTPGKAEHADLSLGGLALPPSGASQLKWRQPLRDLQAAVLPEAEVIAKVKREPADVTGQLVAVNDTLIAYVTGKDGRIRVIHQVSGASSLLILGESSQAVVDLALNDIAVSPSVRATLVAAAFASDLVGVWMVRDAPDGNSLICDGGLRTSVLVVLKDSALPAVEDRARRLAWSATRPGILAFSSGAQLNELLVVPLSSMAAVLAAQQLQLQQQTQDSADAVPPPTEALAVAKAVKLAGHGLAVTDLAFDRAGDVLWSAAADGTVRQWALAAPAVTATEPPVLTVTNRDGQPEGISRFALYYPSPKAKAIALVTAAADGKTLRVWSLQPSVVCTQTVYIDADGRLLPVLSSGVPCIALTQPSAPKASVALVHVDIRDTAAHLDWVGVTDLEDGAVVSAALVDTLTDSTMPTLYCAQTHAIVSYQLLSALLEHHLPADSLRERPTARALPERPHAAEAAAAGSAAGRPGPVVPTPSPAARQQQRQLTDAHRSVSSPALQPPPIVSRSPAALAAEAAAATGNATSPTEAARPPLQTTPSAAALPPGLPVIPGIPAAAFGGVVTPTPTPAPATPAEKASEAAPGTTPQQRQRKEKAPPPAPPKTAPASGEALADGASARLEALVQQRLAPESLEKAFAAAVDSAFGRDNRGTLAQTIATQVEKQVAKSMQDTVAKSVAAAVDKALRKDAVTTETAKAVAAAVQPALTEALGAAVQSAVVPALERVLQATMTQTHMALQRGANEDWVHGLPALAGLTAAATAEATAIKAMGEQLRAAAAEAARAAEASQQRFLAELTRTNEAQHAKLLAAIQTQLGQFCSALAAAQGVVAAGDSGGSGVAAAKPAPTAESEVGALLRERKYPEAIVRALAAPETDLIQRVLKRVPITEVFDTDSITSSPRLSNTHMVALLQAIAARLQTDVESKLKWVDQLLLCINVADLPRTVNFAAILQELVTVLADLVKRADANPKEVGLGSDKIRSTLNMAMLLLRTTPASPSAAA